MEDFAGMKRSKEEKWQDRTEKSKQHSKQTSYKLVLKERKQNSKEGWWKTPKEGWWRTPKEAEQERRKRTGRRELER